MVSTCPSSYVSPSLPPSLPPSSTPSPTFLAFAAAAAAVAVAANDGTHVRDPSRTRRTMCVPYQPVGSRAHAALRTTPYSIPIPPTQPATTAIPPAPLPPAPLAPFLCTPLQPLRRPFVQPAMQPPQEATLIISIFPIRSGGRETCNTLPSARSLHTPLSFSPCSPRSSGSSTTHEASPSSRLPLLPPGSQPKEKYLYLSVSSRDTAPLPLPSTLFYPLPVFFFFATPRPHPLFPRSRSFSFFLSFLVSFFLGFFLSFFLSTPPPPPPPCEFLGLSHPFLGLSLPFRLSTDSPSRSRVSFLPFGFLLLTSTQPPPSSYGVVAGETDTRRVRASRG